MSSSLRTLITYIGALGIIGSAIFILINTQRPPLLPAPENAPPAETAQVANVSTANPNLVSPTITRDERENPADLSEKTAILEKSSASAPPIPNTGQTTASVARIPNPYPFPPESLLAVNQEMLGALVNIFCTTERGSLRPTSGSGVIIDPRGVILTNAHIAQYVLLAQSSETSLSCVIRSGAPARALWEVEVLYIPPVWIHEHATDITNTSPTGTGEHDYALLRITGLWDGPIPPTMLTPVPALPVDAREGIGFLDDLVLAASYPAEFIGSVAAQSNLYPVSSVAPIKELLTFESSTVDLISLGGVIEAQGGSSGGAVVNAWGRLIGIITTTSEGATTAERELRAVTLSYINRDLASQTGLDLATILSGDVVARAAEFRTMHAPALTQILIEQISKKRLP